MNELQPSRRELVRGAAASGAAVWVAPAIVGVHLARAETSGPDGGHAISFVGIVYRTLNVDGTSAATTHLMKAEFDPGAVADPDEGTYKIVGDRWLVETDRPQLPNCDVDQGTLDNYLPGDVAVIDPAGPLAGAFPAAAFADELDEDGEPRRVILGIAAGHELVTVYVKCGQDCMATGADALSRTFDEKFVIDNCLAAASA